MPDPPDAPTYSMKTIRQETLNGKRYGIMKEGDDFDNKAHCMYEIGKKALDEGFEFKTRKSDTLRYDVICKDDDCKWKIVSKQVKNGSHWVLGKVNDIHTCSRTQLNPNHRNATKKLLGFLISPKLKDYSRIYKPKDIINDINLEYNIDITYKKAWGGRNKALQINSGCPIESFSELPLYFHNLKMANEGTVTHIETDDEGRFKMCFVAFGFAIRSFLTHMRPLLITDGAHLKGIYKGTNLVLVGMDGNNQIIPIAIGVTQGETGESWTWFFSKLRECIGEVPNLAIITDRHPTIIQSCNTVFPNAFHGYCCRHLMMNCKMKSEKLQAIYWKTCKAYTPEEFQRRITYLRSFRPEAYKKLEDAGFETWSRAMCPANHYNYTTLNSVESINNLTRHVRKVSVTKLMEWYRALLQKWYCDRREKYKDSNVHTLSDWATHKVMDRMQKSANWRVHGILHSKIYQVDDRRRVHRVDLNTRSCSCHKWQLSGIPCGHVIAVARVMGCTDCSELALGWFRKTTLYSTYQELVYPLGESSTRHCPDGLQVVKPPKMDFPKPGRPKKIDRIKSQGEEPIQVRCSRCSVRGHTRASCHEPIPNYGRSQVEEYEAAYNNNNERSQEYAGANNNNYGRTQEYEYEAAYNNNNGRSQEYAGANNNNYGRTQEYEYEAAYNNNNGRSQEYAGAYNNNYGRTQEYNAAYNNFNGIYDQPDNMGFAFNFGQSSQQTNSTWDHVNLADP
ncbi:transposase, MuDR, MULE transposase domain protein [Tanacetum coccineum]